MSKVIRIADAKGRVSLPGFAHATVIVDMVSDNEYRIRKARIIPEEELRFSEEEFPIKLSERDAKDLVRAIENPPRPNAVARRAARHRADEDHPARATDGTDQWLIR